MKQQLKYRTVRFGLIDELDDLLEQDRMSVPVGSRLNKSAHIRQILWAHVTKKQKGL